MSLRLCLCCALDGLVHTVLRQLHKVNSRCHNHTPIPIPVPRTSRSLSPLRSRGRGETSSSVIFCDQARNDWAKQLQKGATNGKENSYTVQRLRSYRVTM